MRLNSVDLPTFGRPIMATTGFFILEDPPSPLPLSLRERDVYPTIHITTAVNITILLGIIIYLYITPLSALKYSPVSTKHI